MEEEADLSDIETTEFDWLVVDAAMDVVSGLAVALGPSFAELWKIFEKQVLRYASGGEPLERASACGVLAETITGMAEGVTPYTASMMQVLLKRLGDEDAQTKSNAAYAIGRLVEKSGDVATVVKAYPQVLSKLEALFSINEGRCKDNAAGCVSRLILKHKDKVPVAEVLPALVASGVLPLKEDYEENEPVWKMIVEMCKLIQPSGAECVLTTVCRQSARQDDPETDSAVGTNHDVYARRARGTAYGRDKSGVAAAG